MEISNKLKDKIERYITNKNLVKKLLSLDPKAIEFIGQMSQSGIKPEKVIKAYKQGKMENIFKEATIKQELWKIYTELNNIYYAQVASQNHIEER